MKNKIDFITFKVSDFEFSFKTEHVREIVHMAELLTPPGIPSFIEGFLNVAGTVIPVVSLSQLFFSSAAVKQLYTPIIILKPSTAAENPWAVLVDSVLEINTLPEEKLLPVKDEHVFTNCVTAVFENHQQKVYLLDPGRILLELEEKRMLEFREMAQKRLNKTQTKKTKAAKTTKTKTRNKET